MLLIFTETITARLRYILDLVVGDMLGMSFRLTGSPAEFNACEGPRLWYAGVPPAAGLFVEASGLLAGHGVSPVDPGFAVHEGVPVLLPSGNPLSALPFDPFAAAFYMVTRYEEYLPHGQDRFGRFPATASVAFRHGFLGIPVVHAWADMVGRLLQSRYPELKVRKPAYRYTPTIDIDHAWCYLGRTPLRTIGGMCRSAFHGRVDELSQRIRVLAGSSPDPYDSYAYITGVHEPYGILPLWFMLFADYGGEDNNVTLNSPELAKLLRNLDSKGGVGIHPSLSSGHLPEKLAEEHNGLCAVLERPVKVSRQHFLHVSFPQTYRRLAGLGITDDYSMGFATHAGFRAGTAMPFRFFDLTADEVSGLTVHPVSVMDVTLRDHLRLTPDEGLRMIAETIRKVRDAGGEFVSLWHNESLDESGRWKGWRKVYREMVSMASA